MDVDLIVDNEKLVYSIINKFKGYFDMDDLYQFFGFARNEYAAQRGQLLCADETVVEKYREQHLIEKVRELVKK